MWRRFYCASFSWWEANCRAIADADVICLSPWTKLHCIFLFPFFPFSPCFFLFNWDSGLQNSLFPWGRAGFYSSERGWVTVTPATGPFSFLYIDLRKGSAASFWRIGYTPWEHVINLLVADGFTSLTGAYIGTTCLWNYSLSASLMYSQCAGSVLLRGTGITRVHWWVLSCACCA